MPTAISGRKAAISSLPDRLERRGPARTARRYWRASTAELDEPRQAPRLPPDRPRARRCARLIDCAVVSRVSIWTARNGHRRGEQARGVGMADRGDDHRPQRDRRQPAADIRAATGGAGGAAVTARSARPKRDGGGSRCGSGTERGLWSKRRALSIAPPMALHGWIIIDKPLGLGSTNVVGWVKRALREAGEPKTRVGHGGTLDPLATGVLPIAIGEATKLAGHMLDATKAYDFTIAFGAQTDTLDLEGKVIATSDHLPDPRRDRSGPAALHRPDRAGAARIFGAQGRRPARLRPRPRRRGGSNSRRLRRR